MKNVVTRFFEDESGVTAIEYGLIAALISVVCIAAMTFAGQQLLAVHSDWQLSGRSSLVKPRRARLHRDYALRQSCQLPWQSVVRRLF
jgi:pilus assembly protein Flp/PilA